MAGSLHPSFSQYEHDAPVPEGEELMARFYESTQEMVDVLINITTSTTDVIPDKDEPPLERMPTIQTAKFTKARLHSCSVKTLADYLADLSGLLYYKVIPQAVQMSTEMQTKVEEQSEVMKLQSQLIQCQQELNESRKDIIDLQKRFIEKKEENLCKVESTVQEIQSYSSVLQSAVTQCTSALAPSKIRVAMSMVKEDLSSNLMVHGLSEKEEEDLKGAVREVLGSLSPPEAPVIEEVRRVGRKVEGKERPVKITLRSKDIVSRILARKTSLRDSESFRRVYLSPDMTIEEREARGRLVGELKERRERESEKRFCIRRGVVVEALPV